MQKPDQLGQVNHASSISPLHDYVHALTTTTERHPLGVATRRGTHTDPRRLLAPTARAVRRDVKLRAHTVPVSTSEATNTHVLTQSHLRLLHDPGSQVHQHRQAEETTPRQNQKRLLEPRKNRAAPTPRSDAPLTGPLKASFRQSAPQPRRPQKGQKGPESRLARDSRPTRCRSDCTPEPI